MQAHLATSKGFFSGGKEVGRCACITVQLQLEDCSPRRCQILAVAQVNLTPAWDFPSVNPLPRSNMNL